MITFNDFELPLSLLKALDENGIEIPTPIQEKSFKKILSGKDIMAIAQTGTGKTYAYLIPILKQWKFLKTDSPRVVIIVPTRELVVQVTQEVEKLTKYMDIKCLGIYGGVNINTQKTNINLGVDIIIGTPGRTMDLALDGILRFDVLQKLVLDEFDEILNQGFRFQITSLLAMMKNKRQNILFSATMTDDIDDVLEEFFNLPEEVSLAPSGTPLEKINQLAYKIPNFLTKINVLNDLLNRDNEMEKVLIFVNQKKLVDLVFEKLDAFFPEQFGVIHSNKTQNYRLSVLQAFQNNELRGIITTDVMARGLDIDNISHVINFDFPEISEQYIHRIGRTGRQDKYGVSISFITPKEEEFLVETELFMNKEIKILDINENIEIEDELLDFEKTKVKVKHLMKKIKLIGGGAYHEKKDKNKKVNLGGPGVRYKKKK
jgi:ATP-dependent RNA helicase RhlE